ncbi:MAG: GNAT family protein [Bacteroidia bacterium]|jgi:RimJ/RimL family protein N-acetyltransferase
MELKTERLKLRELLLADLKKIHELHSSPETDKFNTLGIPDTIEVTHQLISEWLATQDELPRRKFVFCAENIEKEFIGLIGLNIGKPTYRNAEVWFKFHPKFWNQGFATEAVNRILQFSFTVLNLHRIEAGCAVENLASKRVLEKVGMIKEGQCRKKLPIRGQWVDNFEFAILDTDFNFIK